jgi:2'-5' RNA ligase
MSNTNHALSSDLTGEARAGCQALWDDLERKYGLREARAAVRPHVTYVVGCCENPDALAAVLPAAASRIAAFDIEIDGVGVFEGPQPVVFLKPVKSAALEQAHEVIAEAMREAGLALWPYYEADAWVPHVTLALKDLRSELLPAVLAELHRTRTRYLTRLEAVDLVHVVMPEHVHLTSAPFSV